MAARLLMAAGEAASEPDRLPFGVRLLIDAADQIVVIAPRLPGRSEWLSSATYVATERADQRLQEVLGHLDELGVEATGRVGPTTQRADCLCLRPARAGLRPTASTGWASPASAFHARRAQLTDTRQLVRAAVAG